MASAVPFPGAQRFLTNRRTLPLLGCRKVLPGLRSLFECDTGRFWRRPETARWRWSVNNRAIKKISKDVRLSVLPAEFSTGLSRRPPSNVEAYVTNAVKHFKFEERGKRRLHQKPRMAEMHACQPWLEAEMELMKPQVIVCLGATGCASVSGKQVSADEGTRHSISSMLGAAPGGDHSSLGHIARAGFRAAGCGVFKIC